MPKPKILWMSPYSLHDSSSGASVDAKDMLESLVKRGFEVWSCASFVFDNVAGTVTFGDLKKTLAESKDNTFILDDNGIHYVYTRCQSRASRDFTMAEGELFYQTYLKVLDEFAPDIVFGYGLGTESIAAWAEAKRRGISTVYILVNGNHGNYSFPHIDAIITDSQATANLYAQRDKINVIPTGAFFVNRQRYFVPPEQRQGKYITMVNPVPSKGLAIFAKLAAVCQKKHKNLRFLTVNSRGVFTETVSSLYERDDKSKHPFSNYAFKNVDMVGGQANMAPVYQMTKVMLTPSLAYESWGRVASEAVINGIPVLSTNIGGISEATAGGGISLEAPEALVKDNFVVPTDEEIQPFLDALLKLCNEDYSEQLAQAQAKLDYERATDRVMEVFLPLVAKTQRNRAYIAQQLQALKEQKSAQQHSANN